MWKEDKDVDLYFKRDDDSAIGDSANNSAEEETTISRRKSSIVDDITDLQTEPYVQLMSKLSTKIPDCLLKDSEESLESCMKISTNSQGIRSSPKRVIHVLPTAAVLTEKPKGDIKKGRTSQANMSVLKAKLQYLFFEMKKLREIDHDILRTFASLNESVEEIRLKIDEKETTLKQNLDDDLVDDDVAMTSPESRLSDWDELDFVQTHVEKDEKFVVPVSKLPTSFASYVKSNKMFENPSMSSSSVTSSSDSTLLKEICEIVNSNLMQPEKSKEPENKQILVEPISNANAAYDLLDVNSTPHSKRPNKQHGHSPASAIEIEKLCSKGYYRFKSPHPSPRPVRVAPDAEVWVKKETTKATESSSNETKRTQRPRSGTIPTKKHNDRKQQQQKQPSHNSSKSGRMTSNESSHVNRRSEWLAADSKQKKKFSDFHTQSDYKSLIGLSRVSGNSAPTNRQNPVQNLSDNSEHASSSTTSSLLTSPLRNPGSSSSNKWSRFGLKRNSKSLDIHNSNNNSAVFVSKNLKPNGVASPDSSSVVAVSYKQRTSDIAYSWVQSQDDITFL